MQCHRSKLDRLRSALAGMATGSAPYAGSEVGNLTDEVGLRLISRMSRREHQLGHPMTLAELAVFSSRRSRQRASGTRGRSG